MSKLGTIVLYSGLWDQEKKDLEYSRAIGIYVIANELNAMIQNVFAFDNTISSVIKIIIMASVFFALLRRVLHYSRFEFQALLCPLVLFVFLYGYSYILGVDSSNLIDWGITSFGICVPLGVFAYLIERKEVLVSVLYKCSWIVLVILLVDIRGSSVKNYDMHFSYMMLFVLLFHISHMVSHKKYYLLPVTVAELILIAVYGSRGAIVGVSAYVVLRVLTNTKSIEKKTIMIAFGILAVLIAVFLIFNYGTSLLELFQSFGFNARSVRHLIEGTFLSHDSGRSIVWNETVELIKERPILGWGIRGAKEYLSNAYPHQLFLDCWLSFGCVLGTLLIVLILVPIRKVFSYKLGTEKDLMQLFFCMSFVILMFSGTLFTFYFFYVFMGLAISAKDAKKRFSINRWLYSL